MSEIVLLVLVCTYVPQSYMSEILLLLFCMGEHLSIIPCIHLSSDKISDKITRSDANGFNYLRHCGVYRIKSKSDAIHITQEGLDLMFNYFTGVKNLKSVRK